MEDVRTHGAFVEQDLSMMGQDLMSDRMLLQSLGAATEKISVTSEP